MTNKSSIIIRTKYQTCKDLKHSVAKTINYISDKKKADSSTIDEYNILKDYLLFGDNDSYLYEDKECFTWSMNGDINAKEELNNINNLDSSGTLWSLVISFDPEFAINNGLITKVDYYNLTKKIMPYLLTSMGMKLNNVSWYCSLHRNTAHPHLHIAFFEHNKTISNPKIPYSCIYEMKSNIANYLIDNEKFYKLRDEQFKSITGDISLQELTKIKNQKLYSDEYRRKLNKMLIKLYNELPDKGRLQYNSKNMALYKDDLDKIIEYILMHDSVKYDYAKYDKLLKEHQKELRLIYGDSKNPNYNYYENQINKLYSKIGNEILENYKTYKSLDFYDKQKEFIKKHIMNFDFKSIQYKTDKKGNNKRNDLAERLYCLCKMSDLNYNQTRYVLDKWIRNSNYDMNVDNLLLGLEKYNKELSISEYYDTMKKLGYDSTRLSKIQRKNFYQEVNYKMFINKAVNHLKYELEKEEQEIEKEIEYELEEKI
ncbi:MAG: hypothetical protein J6O56_03310 [Bacilli bacterium]|nr:hypothetical protein [Bacilli bacterium]